MSKSGSGPPCSGVAGARAMVVASDSGIDAGAIQHMGREKLLRAQNLAMENRLPFVHLVESAGANLLKYRVEGFIHGEDAVVVRSGGEVEPLALGVEVNPQSDHQIDQFQQDQRHDRIQVETESVDHGISSI